MTYMLFMDETGHHGDSRDYEVRGGIAIPSSQVWDFTRKMRGLESRCFGDLLAKHGSEIKAVKLLKPRRMEQLKWRDNFSDEERQALCLAFLGQSRNKANPSADQAAAYAQAGALFVTKLLDLIKSSHGRVFASIVPAGHAKPNAEVSQNFVRKDICFLFQRYYAMLEEMEANGLIVLDETDRTDDKRFLRRLERYFSTHAQGQQHSKLILPTPLFTASDMSYPVQAADIVIYLIAKKFRLSNMSLPVREDLKDSWIKKVRDLQYETSRTDAQGGVYTMRSIVFVEEPWPKPKKKEGKTHLQDDQKAIPGAEPPK